MQQEDGPGHTGGPDMDAIAQQVAAMLQPQLDQIQCSLEDLGGQVGRLSQVEQVAVAAQHRGATTVGEMVKFAVDGALRSQDAPLRAWEARLRAREAALKVRGVEGEDTEHSAATVAGPPRWRGNIARTCTAACIVVCLATAGVSYLVWGDDSASRHDVPTAALPAEQPPAPAPKPPQAGTGKTEDPGKSDGQAKATEPDAPAIDIPLPGARVDGLPDQRRLSVDEASAAGSPTAEQLQAPAAPVGSECGRLQVNLRRLQLCRRVASD